MIAYIIASGSGSRLKQLDTKTPKGLFPINGIPFMEYLLLELCNVSHIYITSNAENYSPYCEFINNFSLKYTKSNIRLFQIAGNFDEVLFTLNDLVKPTEPICLCCCDNIAPLRSYLNSLENNILGNKYDQIIIAPKLKKWQQYGVITISDDKSHVTSFRHNELIVDEEKKMYDEQYIDGGITITCHDFVDKIKGAGGFSKYMKISLSTKRVGYFVPEIWFDIGNVDSYNYTCKSSLFMTYFSNRLTYE